VNRSNFIVVGVAGHSNMQWVGVGRQGDKTGHSSQLYKNGVAVTDPSGRSIIGGGGVGGVGGYQG